MNDTSQFHFGRAQSFKIGKDVQPDGKHFVMNNLIVVNDINPVTQFTGPGRLVDVHGVTSLACDEVVDHSNLRIDGMMRVNREPVAIDLMEDVGCPAKPIGVPIARRTET